MTNPIAIKCALNLLGHDVGGHRLPLVDPTDDEREAVRAASSGSGCSSRLRVQARRTYTQRVDPVRIIPLGGLGEVGKNMTVYEYRGERSSSTPGLAFPRDEHLGVDLVLPDFATSGPRHVRAIVLTHGHEDHVGSLPYVLREIKVKRCWRPG